MNKWRGERKMKRGTRGARGLKESGGKAKEMWRKWKRNHFFTSF